LKSSDILRNVAHRPWPLPSGAWVMRQDWHDLLFAHWPIAPDRMRRLVPAELTLDTFEGNCWVGVIPFHMSGIRGRGLPPVLGLSSFPELNVRTYVTVGAKPGVYFFSLDAASAPAVWAARRFYHLPYFRARMRADIRQNEVRYSSSRLGEPAEFRARYRPTGRIEMNQQESIGRWLTERYCLYTVVDGQVFRGEIHHAPWPLQAAAAEIQENTMAAAAGISLPSHPPLLHFAKRLEVLIWPLVKVGMLPPPRG
jgi:uncharacterized protein